jgi:hypothetical protein
MINPLTPASPVVMISVIFADDEAGGRTYGWLVELRPADDIPERCLPHGSFSEEARCTSV